MKENSLRSSEWLLAGSLTLLLASLFAISKIQAFRFSADGFRSPPAVEVVIEGFVAKPGTYSIASGAPLKEALRKARPKRFADLRSIDMEGRVKEPTHLTINKLETIQIELSGAVINPGLIEVFVGARICDLKKIISLSPEADMTFFKQRKIINDGQLIIVPFKN